ncbi:alpha/beta hydrolase [Rhodanobacter sp. Col0626]|uniref:alpha/beta hydrolase n=1 Tax=Rhodanobacter sp. Col0626 TaxID=3415679 RepID=UPI003CE9FB50
MSRCSVFLAALAGLFCAVAMTPAIANDVAPAQTIALWPGTPPGGGSGPRGAERMGQSGTGVGAVSNISRPRIEIYKPARPNGTAVLLIGGGGYFRIGIGHEVMPTARWLAALGVTPVVLYYRLPGEGWTPAAPFQDGQRAMRILRAKAGELGIDPKRIGVIGFSAGGNLAGIVATRFAHPFYAPVDAADQQSARPDFAGLIYPVSTLQAPYATTRSVRELSAQPDAATAYTIQLHVGHDTPPTFVTDAVDDPIVNVDTGLSLFAALLKQHVPAELHEFETGGHGWGLGKPGTLVAAWPRLFATWARSHGFMPAAASASPFAVSPQETPAVKNRAAADDGDTDDN